MALKLTPNVDVHRDPSGRIRSLSHVAEPFQPAGVAPLAPRQLAEEYLREVAPHFQLEETALTTLAEKVDGRVRDEGVRLRWEREKRIGDVSVEQYAQTYRGLKVWNSSVAVRVHTGLAGVIGSESQVDPGIHAELPDLQTAPFAPERLSPETLRRALNVKTRPDEPVINHASLVVYQFVPEDRFTEVDPSNAGFEEPAERLPLPPLSGRHERSRYYVVTKVQFTLSTDQMPEMYWTALLDTESGEVLYVRPHTSGVNGSIFQIDPPTQGCPTCTGATAAATLDLYATQLPLDGLMAGNPQTLVGNYISVQQVVPPAYVPPTAPAGTDFLFSSTTTDFAAVNAYFHCDFLYRYLAGLGIDIATYFSGTTFPIPTDPRALGGSVNAQARGNATSNGMGSYVFGVVQSGFTVGIATAARVVLHEFGHALLWDHVDSPNFGFAHSAGDSMACIYADPNTRMADRGLTFPFPNIGRRNDRTVAGGWAWFGPNWNTQYGGEQVLSSTMFRAYLSTGGGATALAFRLFASQYMFYLVVQACGLLTAMTGDPTVYANALIQADMATTNFQGQTGGTNYKVIRWSFEKQGLYQPAGAPQPITTEGQPPPTDVYIDDGRGGEYTYQANWWSTQDVWNRLAADAGTTHQNPVSGQVNYAYVLLKNRGTGSAANASVRGFQGAVGSGFNWPGDFTPMATPAVAAPGLITSGGQVVLGPFNWTPAQSGNGAILMVATADGDASIVENPLILNLPIPNWRFVPFDNNIAQRNVTIT